LKKKREIYFFFKKHKTLNKKHQNIKTSKH